MAIWPVCLERLQEELPQNLFNMWIRPLQAEESVQTLKLLAPNPFFVRHISDKYLARIRELTLDLSQGRMQQVQLAVGSRNDREVAPASTSRAAQALAAPAPIVDTLPRLSSNLNPFFTFENFVSGKSNQLAFAACHQVAGSPG